MQLPGGFRCHSLGWKLGQEQVQKMLSSVWDVHEFSYM